MQNQIFYIMKIKNFLFAAFFSSIQIITCASPILLSANMIFHTHNYSYSFDNYPHSVLFLLYVTCAPIVLGGFIGSIFGVSFGIAGAIVYSVVGNGLLGDITQISYGMAIMIAGTLAGWPIITRIAGISFWAIMYIAAAVVFSIAGGTAFWKVIFFTIIIGLTLAAIVSSFSIFHVKNNTLLPAFLWSVGGIAGGIALSSNTDTTYGMVYGASVIFISLRPHYYLLHILWFFPFPRPLSYQCHPVAWDDACIIAFPKLDALLVNYYEVDNAGALAEIDHLTKSYPSQRQAALRAATIISIRATTKVSLEDIEKEINLLPEGDAGFLTQTPKIKLMANEISYYARRALDKNSPIDHTIYTEKLINCILAFRGITAGFHEPLASEFRAASNVWLGNAQALRGTAKAKDGDNLAVPHLFRAGDPVNREQEAFVARMDVLTELGRQVLLAGGCPGLILYGRRRVGKTSVLHGLNGLIPPSIMSIEVSLQNPAANADVTYFCGHLLQKIGERLKWPEEFPDTADLPALMKGLERANGQLLKEDLRLLLALDEYEKLDERLREGAFPDDFLGAIRESIQTHRRIIWLFAGSHHIDELSHRDWASHLISVRMVPVKMFTADESRALLTNPLATSPLFSSPDDPRRPRIPESFWGDGGIDWIQQTAGGWPHLVQLLAEAVVDEVNDRGAAACDNAWRDDLLDRAAQRGEMVLRHLLLGESLLPGEADYVKAFAETPAQTAPADRAVAKSLHRRELITVDANNLWRLRVPLMQHWLEKNRYLL